MTACCFALFIGSLYWKKGTAKGAVAGSVVGLILVTLSLTKILILPLRDLTPVVIAVVIYVIVSLSGKEGRKKQGYRTNNGVKSSEQAAESGKTMKR